MNHNSVLLQLFVGSLFLTVDGFAQSHAELLKDESFKIDVAEALDYVYNLQFTEARFVLSPWEEKHPNHPIWTFWEGLELWWTILPDLNDESKDEQFYYTFRKLSYECGKILSKKSNHCDALILQTLALGFTARQLSNRDEWIQSINYGRYAVESLRNLENYYPEMSDLLFGEGMFNYYLDYLPRAYTMLEKVDWALPKGDMKLGLEQLDRVSREGLFLKSEAAYFLANIYGNYEDKPDSALKYYLNLQRTFPENPFYVNRLVDTWYATSSYYLAISKADSLLESLNTDMYRYQAVKADIISRKGRALTLSGRFNEAIELLSNLDLPFSTYQRASNLFYLARSYQLSNDIENAISYYKEVSNSGVKPFSKRADDLLNRLK